MQRNGDLSAQTAAYLREQQLATAGELWLVAVSGGQDSCVLLHLLQALRQRLGLSLAVAHFDHGLRPESGQEQQFVRELAAGYGLPFYADGADVRAAAAGKNLEETGRRLRYAFLRRTAAASGAAKIATAHHAQDQAETLLLHLLRGSGGEGLAAMAPLERNIIRPLLFAQPAQIRAYAELQGLAYCEDSSNASVRYTRNRIRLELLPQLQAYNPRVVEALATTADICREENEMMHDLAETALAELWLDAQSALDGPGFDELPLALKRRVLRKAFALVVGEKAELSFLQVQAAIALQEEQSCAWPGGWLAYRRGALYIAKEQPPLPQYAQTVALKWDGNWHKLPDWGWEYRAELAVAPEHLTDGIVLPATLRPHLLFRTRRPGDAVASTGKQGQRKVKDIFIAHKIAPYLRAAWPLLLAGEEIIWLPFLYRKSLPAGEEALVIRARPCQQAPFC